MAKFPGKVVTIRQFLKEEENVEWLIQDLLPNVGWTLLVGQKGIGKTTFCLQLCDALQEGKSIFDRKVKKTNVLYIQTDSPNVEWKAILERVAPNSVGWTMVSIPEYSLDNSEYVSTMASLAVITRPGILVFDSLYKFTRKNINSERILDVISTMQLISGPMPFIVIHHPPHGESRASGHNSLEGNCSNAWYLLRTKLKIEKGRLVKDKEILLSRDSEGLWILKASDDRSSDDLMNKPIF